MAQYKKEFKGISHKKSYDSHTALSLAVACELAYEDADQVKETVLDWGFLHCEFISVKKGLDIDTQCYVMADKKNLVIVFRGSESLEDWLCNVQVTREAGPFKGTLVHEGFLEAIYPVALKVSQTISEFRYEGQKIWVVGHSLGGALCSIFSGLLLENEIPVYGVYTFASPRPGDDQFAKALNAAVPGPHYRVVNKGDIVPHLPPEPFFSHAGERILLEDRLIHKRESAWLAYRVDMLTKMMKRTFRNLNANNCHQLIGSKVSYTRRLIADINRKLKSAKHKA